MLVAKATRLAQVGPQLLVVVAQLGEHIQGRNVLGVLIQKTLQTANVADRTQRVAIAIPPEFSSPRLCQSRGWSSSVEGCSCNEQMSPPPKSSSGCGCVRLRRSLLPGKLFYAFEHDVFPCTIVKLKESHRAYRDRTCDPST